MSLFRKRRQHSFAVGALPIVIGAFGGLGIGIVVAMRRRPVPYGYFGEELRDRARGGAVAGRPERRDQLVSDQSELSALEDAVLDAFLGDSVLSQRGIDVGAISRGIVELSGSVWTEQEADHAVHLANRVTGVDTVVDRLEIDDQVRHLDENRRRLENGDPALNETQWQGRRIGMGRMRQGGQTEPDRPDESQRAEERALEKADRDEWVAEGITTKRPLSAERPEEARASNQPDFDADELDNQDPHGHGNTRTLDHQPQELNTSTRVGEGSKPGVELALEGADVPLKPHGEGWEAGAQGAEPQD